MPERSVFPARNAFSGLRKLPWRCYPRLLGGGYVRRSLIAHRAATSDDMVDDLTIRESGLGGLAGGAGFKERIGDLFRFVF